MDPLRCLNAVQLQDPLSNPLDLTKQISKALDLVKKKPSRSGCASGTHGLRSPRSDFGYESACVPLKSSLRNGFAHEPAKTLTTATGNFQSDGAPGKVATWHRTGGERGRNGAGLQDVPSERSPVLFPAVETLSSECSRYVRAESVSSDDSSVIEVPTSNATSLSLRITENQKRERERTENSPILIESDVLQDSDSLESKNVPSTSEADNADFKSTRKEFGPSSTSLSLTNQKRAPETNKNRTQQRTRSSAGKTATASAAKRRKKKKKFSSSPSGFPSHEPEITLKYASCKEGKREGRGNYFAPYVRMDFSACTVVNFEDDGEVQVKKRCQTATVPGIVPRTSCLQLGRLGSSVRCQTEEQCRLCGRTANAAGLGDLHGPYHSHRTDRKTSADLLINGHEDGGARRTRESDEVREHWVHEDCSIWSAGVFLVKGRLYGLEEAVRLAQETVCSCCLTPGATLGCFLKRCPNKYHFPCAFQAGCVFNNENFTLRCPKHKNKSGATPSRLQNRWRCKDELSAHHNLVYFFYFLFSKQSFFFFQIKKFDFKQSISR